MTSPLAPATVPDVSSSLRAIAYVRGRRRTLASWLVPHVTYIGLVCSVLPIAGCREEGDPAVKELIIASQNDEMAVREVVALVGPDSLEEAGISEDSFREEMREVLARAILRVTVVEQLGEFFGESDDSCADEGDSSELPLPGVRSKAMQSLLDDGVRIEIRTRKNGKVEEVSRLTITSSGISEEGWEPGGEREQ